MKQEHCIKLNASHEDIETEDLTLRFFENSDMKNKINECKYLPAISSKKKLFFEKRLMNLKQSGEKKQSGLQTNINPKHSKKIIFTKFMPNNLQHNITIIRLNRSKEENLLTIPSQSGTLYAQHNPLLTNPNYQIEEKKKHTPLNLHKSKIIFTPSLPKASLEKVEKLNLLTAKPISKKPPLPLSQKKDFHLKNEKSLFEECQKVKALSKKNNSSNYIYTFNTISCNTPKIKENMSFSLKHSLVKKMIEDSIKANRVIEHFPFWK